MSAKRVNSRSRPFLLCCTKGRFGQAPSRSSENSWSGLVTTRTERYLRQRAILPENLLLVLNSVGLRALQGLSLVLAGDLSR